MTKRERRAGVTVGNGTSAVKPFSILKAALGFLAVAYCGWFLANAAASVARLEPVRLPVAWFLVLGGIALGVYAARVVVRGARTPLWLGALLLGSFALVAGLQLRTSVIERVRVSGNSMLPAYRDGETLWVQKVSLGLRLPALRFPFGSGSSSSLFGPLLRLPPRGAVVVIRFPGTSRLLVKRVFALPGESYDLSGEPFGGGVGPLASIDFEREPYRRLGARVRHSQLAGVPRRGIVPPDALLVLGDNRTLSRDSRVFGFVPILFLEGVALGNGRPR